MGYASVDRMLEDMTSVELVEWGEYFEILERDEAQRQAMKGR